MCLTPKAPQIPVQQPLPPAAAPVAPEAPADSALNNPRAAAYARRSLRIDLATPGSAGNGLSIPK